MQAMKAEVQEAGSSVPVLFTMLMIIVLPSKWPAATGRVVVIQSISRSALWPEGIYTFPSVGIHRVVLEQNSFSLIEVVGLAV